MTITGSEFAITAPAGATFTLSGASWCVKSALAKTDPSAGTGLRGSSPSVKKGTAQDVGYVTVYSVTTAEATTTCYDDTKEDPFEYNDLLLSGPVGVFANAYQTDSQDGTCSGGQVGGYLVSVVSAPDATQAASACLSLSTPSALLESLAVLWDAPPSTDLWVCLV